MYVATFLDTWKIGIVVECEADRERELTGRLPRHCLAEHLSTSHLATGVWLLPQDPVLLQSAWLYVVLSRSEHSRLAVSLVDSHWKATTEGASQKQFLVCKLVQKRAAGRSAAPTRATPVKYILSRFLINQVHVLRYWGNSLVAFLIWSVSRSASLLGRFADSTHPLTPRNNIL